MHRWRLSLLALGLASGLALPAQAADEAHAHMGHVLDAWQDTPDQMGLLPTARAEAEIAAQHAGFAISEPDDLDSIKLHVGHVMHAVDPSVEPEGPGLGYGVIEAANGVAQHIQFAAESEGASDNVKLHAEHVATSADNVVDWGGQVLDLGAEVRAAKDAESAFPLAEDIDALTRAMLEGKDADGDGEITWQEGEGGLAQAAQHMEFMKEGEGL